MLQKKKSLSSSVRLGHQAGISLVEILAVVFIVSLMSSMVVISIPAKAPPERLLANALQSSIRSGIDRAILMGIPVAIDLDNNLVETYDWRQSEWVLVEPLSVQIDGKIVTQQVEPHDPYRDDDIPELVCDPTGLVSPAIFRVTGRTERWEIIVSEDGEVLLDAR